MNFLVEISIKASQIQVCCKFEAEYINLISIMYTVRIFILYLEDVYIQIE